MTKKEVMIAMIVFITAMSSVVSAIPSIENSNRLQSKNEIQENEVDVFYKLEVICKTNGCKHILFFASEYQALRTKSCLMQDPNISSVLGPIYCSKTDLFER